MEEVRQSGIEIVGDVPLGTHFCQFYQTKEDLLDVLVPYLRAGLENNELCVWITAESPEVEEAKEALRQSLPEIDAYLEKGQIEIISAINVYVNENTFDPENTMISWFTKLNEALGNGYAGLRAAGDLSWLESEGWSEFIDYERKVDPVVGKSRMISICSYVLDECNAAEIIDVVFSHKFSLIKRNGKWEVLDNLGRTRAEKTLKEKERCFREFFELAAAGLIIYDSDTSYQEVNDRFCEITGYRREELLSMKSSELIHPADRKEYLEGINELLNGQTPFFTKDLRYIHADNRIVWVRMHISLLQNYETLDDFQPKLFGVIEDITERKEAEELRLKIEQSRKKEIHHRIKNNSQVISSLLDLQAERFAEKETVPTKEILEAFRESQNRVMCMALIYEELHKSGKDNKLNFSIYLEKLSKNLFQTNKFGTADISLKTDLEGDIFIDMDTVTPLGIIVNELISNSFKHAFPHKSRGEIQIRLYKNKKGDKYLKPKDDSGKKIDRESVEDTGIIKSFGQWNRNSPKC